MSALLILYDLMLIVGSTIGAGDTFIAGALYALIFEEDNWRMREILQFANDLAGLKVTAEGFQNLAEKIPSLPR